MIDTYIPFAFILMIFAVYVYQETRKTHIIFTCTKCGKRVTSDDIKEGCLCNECYEEELNNDNSERSKKYHYDFDRRSGET